MSKKLVIILSVVFLFVLGGSYVLFSYMSPKKSMTLPPSSQKLSTNTTGMFDASLPKTESCPINGVKYSTQQRDWWQKHRPLGVMIENHEDSRPQSGLSFADTVYEAVAEGGITRFLAIFYCQDAPIIGPIRSARTYFIDFASEYGNSPLYTHVGGANAAGPADGQALPDLGSL
jgi:hypothetical protein